MGSVLKIELKKAFCNKMFCLVLGIGLVIAGISAVQNIQMYYDNLATIAEVQQNSEVLYNPENESVILYNRLYFNELSIIYDCIVLYIDARCWCVWPMAGPISASGNPVM